MKTVTMLEFRRDAEKVLRRLGNGERLVLTHRGKPAARLEPVEKPPGQGLANDPFLTIGQRAGQSSKGPTGHAQIDRVIYGRG